MIDNPLISCIVPTFNCKLYIAEALDSILAQTYRPIEIIVVDDGSTDGTPELLERYGDKIIYVKQDNLGPAAARNLGINMAQGEFIAFLDADDIWRKEKLDRQMAVFTENPELEICMTHIQNFWIPELKHEEERLRNHRFATELPGYVCQVLLAKYAVFDRIGLFDPSLRVSEDSDWFHRAREHGVVGKMIHEVMVYRRMHHNNLSYSLYGENQHHMLEMITRKLNRQRDNYVSDGVGKNHNSNQTEN